jgi:hypothetical protein
MEFLGYLPEVMFASIDKRIVAYRLLSALSQKTLAAA